MPRDIVSYFVQENGYKGPNPAESLTTTCLAPILSCVCRLIFLPFPHRSTSGFCHSHLMTTSMIVRLLCNMQIIYFIKIKTKSKSLHIRLISIACVSYGRLLLRTPWPNQPLTVKAILFALSVIFSEEVRGHCLSDLTLINLLQRTQDGAMYSFELPRQLLNTVGIFVKPIGCKAWFDN